MTSDAFIFTILFLTLGPIKMIPTFANLTKEMTLAQKRGLAIRGMLMALAICLYVSLLGRGIVRSYQISLDALGLATGFILLVSALRAIFPPTQPPDRKRDQPSLWQLAISPVASPIVVTPVGIAAILIFVMQAPGVPGMQWSIAKALLILLGLDFLVMFFIDRITRVPGLMMALQVLGTVLVVVQVALSFETFLVALKSLGVIHH
ncbi:MarC family protein [Variovorax sp. YR216]|uniref:MarC family protein n=1 Tax=Variovorax sp. YR216 TaxID=1882828 RepID=UPI00089789F7|nr:MarC family protein [Variovorax sp. YR216]SEB18983.1 multiple antibiotic resistance protein [Variovorax sp. YR216]